MKTPGIVKKFLRESGHDTPISSAIEQMGDDLISTDSDGGQLNSITSLNGDLGFLIAGEIASRRRDEVLNPRLKERVASVLKDGIARAEPGDQVSERISIASRIIQRGLVGDTCLGEDQVVEIARKVSDRGREKEATEGFGRKYIFRDTNNEVAGLVDEARNSIERIQQRRFGRGEKSR
jgi:hypothetical protein